MRPEGNVEPLRLPPTRKVLCLMPGDWRNHSSAVTFVTWRNTGVPWCDGQGRRVSRQGARVRRAGRTDPRSVYQATADRNRGEVAALGRSFGKVLAVSSASPPEKPHRRGLGERNASLDARLLILIRPRNAFALISERKRLIGRRRKSVQTWTVLPSNTVRSKIQVSQDPGSSPR